MDGKKKTHMKRTSVPKYLDVPKANKHRSMLQNLLLHSPIPSPSLPSILPRHGKKPPPLDTRRVLRWLSWLFILTCVSYVFSWTRPRPESRSKPQIYHHEHDNTDYEIMEESGLPETPVPLAIVDEDGKARWTIHIPANRNFPLSPQEYRDICQHVDDVSSHVAIQRGNSEQLASLNYYDRDPNYMDVSQAQLSELVPFDPAYKPGGELPVCSSTMIYVLDAEDAGLGGSLLGLWLAYGLAQKERRAFFLDDSHFTYGRYSNLLERPPLPNCRPPPPTHRVPCPPMSQHLVVSSATWQWTFGQTFHEKFSEEEVFAMMRIGYEALFKLLPEDQLYVAGRVTELRGAAGTKNLLAGIHIRRGEVHSKTLVSGTGYTPISEYIQKAEELLLSRDSINHVTIVSSDDSAVYKDSAVRGENTIVRAQEKETPPDLLAKGFYSSLFWNAGLPESILRQHKSQALGSPLPNLDHERYQKLLAHAGLDYDIDRDYRSSPTEAALEVRQQTGRSYLLDLAILAQSDVLICDGHTRAGKLLGVMMGWDKASNGLWASLDGLAWNSRFHDRQ